MSNDIPDKLKPFVHHGVDLSWTANEANATGTCHLCDKEDHLYVKKATGQWSCKKCQEGGNIPTFLAGLLEAGQQATTDKALQVLADDRQVPVDELREWGVVVHPLNDGEWLIPAYNDKHKLANLFRVIKVDGKWKALSTATCKLHPMRVPKSVTNKNLESTIICEGPWDGMALRAALKGHRRTTGNNGDAKLIKTSAVRNSLAKSIQVISVPGAGVFQADWTGYCQGKPVFLCYDNDHPRKQRTGKKSRPGWDGMQRAARVMGQHAKCPEDIHIIKWGRTGHSTALADGYDVRDLIGDKGATVAIKTIFRKCKKVKVDRAESDDIPDLEPINCESFADLCAAFGDNLHFHDHMRDTLAVMLSVVTSTTIYGDQVWCRVIGPPGSGKTTLAECVSAAKEYVLARSVLTGFHSGFTAGEGGRKKSASLIPRLKGKTLVVKDADTIVNSSSRDRILAELRDIYDGTSRAEYRNQTVEEHTGIQATFILCGTDELRALNRTFLGERFLDCEIMAPDFDADPFLDRAIDNTWDKMMGSLLPPEDNGGDHEVHGEGRTQYLQRVTMGYIEHIKLALINRTIHAPSYPPAARKQVKALGNLLACVRAKVRRDGDDLLYRPRKELATRLVSQLTKLSGTLALVLGKPSVDREVIRIVRKVVMDTGEGFTLEITRALMPHKQGLSAKQLSLSLGLSEASIKRTLADMAELKLASRKETPNRSGVRGRNAHLFHLTPELKGYWKDGMGSTRKHTTNGTARKRKTVKKG